MANFCFAATPHAAEVASLAQVTSIILSPGNFRAVHPLSSEGVVLIALQDCVALINGNGATFRRGEPQQIQGSQYLMVSAQSGISCRFLLVNIQTAHQRLTVDSHILSRKQSLEDASDRNETLLVALSPL